MTWRVFFMKAAIDPLPPDHDPPTNAAGDRRFNTVTEARESIEHDLPEGQIALVFGPGGERLEARRDRGRVRWT